MVVIGALIPFLHLVFAANALRRSLQDRFIAGVIGSIARGFLLLLGLVLTLRALGYSEQSVPPDLRLSLLALSIVGPLLSFGVLALSWWRANAGPAAREEQASRPVNAWIAVAAVDAIMVIITIGASLISMD